MLPGYRGVLFSPKSELIDLEIKVPYLLRFSQYLCFCVIDNSRFSVVYSM